MDIKTTRHLKSGGLVLASFALIEGLSAILIRGGDLENYLVQDLGLSASLVAVLITLFGVIVFRVAAEFLNDDEADGEIQNVAMGRRGRRTINV